MANSNQHLNILDAEERGSCCREKWFLSPSPSLGWNKLAPFFGTAFLLALMADNKEPEVTGTVKLISADGHEFVVDRKAAMVSGTIKSMLSGPGKRILNFFIFNRCVYTKFRHIH